MRISNLLKPFLEIKAEADFRVTGLALDSRTLNPGEIFCAYPGFASDGRNFIEAAIARGAKAVLAEAGGDFAKHCTVPYFAVEALQQKVAEIAARFYLHPADDLHLIGVTGTNGKTSTAYFISQLKSLLRANTCAMVGTIGAGHNFNLTTLTHTTPDPISLQHIFRRFVSEGYDSVVMEVSSHALDQGRVNGLQFETAIFTNLTHEHLDYHQTMAQYAAAKKRLFTDFKIKNAIINIDDPTGAAWAAEFAADLNVLRLSTEDKSADLYADRIQLTTEGLSAEIKTPWGTGQLQAPIIGRFNVMNLLASIAAVLLQEGTLAQLLEQMQQLRGVTGRMQMLRKPGFASAVIDYAHTPDALQKALQTLQEFCPAKLWCVFGCGGNRDQAKRALMGQVAAQYAQPLILTNDNPRFESPEKIIEEIKQGIPQHIPTQIIPDRKLAIQAALQQAASEDMILIAGKGHENFQIIEAQQIPFKDADIVGEYFVRTP